MPLLTLLGATYLTSRSWEVEQKFHLDEPRLLVEKLTGLGFKEGATHSHEDIYFRHPNRDFKATDEAFRLRRVDDRACITYKGPRQAGPVKMREEIELMVDASNLTQWKSMLVRLGFQQFPPVRKSRREFSSVDSRFLELIVVMDCVEELGDFVEIEILVVDETELPEAQKRVLDLSKQLGLIRMQPRSYLDQLLELREM